MMTKTLIGVASSLDFWGRDPALALTKTLIGVASSLDFWGRDPALARAREFLLDALANDLSGIGRVLLDPRLDPAAVRLLEPGRILSLQDDIAIAGNERSSIKAAIRPVT
jgi:hypothetical protein